MIGQLVYFIGIRRDVTIQNMQRAFPQLPVQAAKEVAARTYRHFGRVAAEFAAVPYLDLKREAGRIVLFGPTVLEEALSGGKGCLVFSGHLGNWELMGAVAAKRGIPVSFVVTTQRNKRVEQFLDRHRQASGIEIIKRREAVRGVLSALRRNRAVAILIDQDAHEDGAFVPFFGQLASTPRGAAIFHLRTGAPLVFAHSVWLPGNRYRILHSPFDTRGIAEADELTARMTERLETAIRETPEQWTWMHRRWKSSPPKS
jgi:KDO2-lipid IV(A) lauroyltransferase